MFAETVARRHTTLSPRGFRKVAVHAEDGWLYVPGFDVHRLDLSGRLPARGLALEPSL